ncbi:hypothetical protein [uncultured Friedmanniella sp.]|uniref:hypothetical protein n=1 Tax=uncultured Friedmanniella sp. TaxID=335381 RepID=UPI0035CC5E50
MTLLPGLACAVWLLLSLASVWVWTAADRPRTPLTRTRVLIGVVAVEVAATAAVGWLAASGPALTAPWSWTAVGLAGLAAVLCGGAVTSSVLALADASSRAQGPRVQRTVLRGGTWIGALERLVMTATVTAGWPEGMAAIVAVKAFARYPELKAGQNSGAIERFIIGTFTSLGWAAACAGLALVLTRP